MHIIYITKESPMNIAVLSDIHGNYIALQKCLEYAIAKGIEAFIFIPCVKNTPAISFAATKKIIG